MHLWCLASCIPSSLLGGRIKFLYLYILYPVRACIWPFRCGLASFGVKSFLFLPYLPPHDCVSRPGRQPPPFPFRSFPPPEVINISPLYSASVPPFPFLPFLRGAPFPFLLHPHFPRFVPSCPFVSLHIHSICLAIAKSSILVTLLSYHSVLKYKPTMLLLRGARRTLVSRVGRRILLRLYWVLP